MYTRKDEEKNAEIIKKKKKTNKQTNNKKQTNKQIKTKLGNKKSPGHDNIKSDLIKTVVNEICYPLVILSVSSGTISNMSNDIKVPKVARVPNSLVITDHSLLCRPFQKSLNVLFITDAIISWLNITSNMALEIIIVPLTLLCWTSLKISAKLVIMTN